MRSPAAPPGELKISVAVATALAIALACPAAWAHTFPPVRTVVMQVERCEVVLLVGYRPGTGEASDATLLRAINQPKSQGLDALRAMLAQQALAPLSLTLDGQALVPTAVRTKIGVEPGGARPMIVVLVTYALPAGKQLALSSKEPRTTRISWADRQSQRIEIARAPAQGKWADGVASFLLPMGPATCASPSNSRQSSSVR
jgi:hypothetical protein